MDDTVGNHRHRTHEVTVVEDSPLGEIVGRRATISCYHHQCISRLGEGLREAAHSADGVIEAVTLDGHAGWYLGVQWHPEDTAAANPVQAKIFRRLVEASNAGSQGAGRPVGPAVGVAARWPCTRPIGAGPPCCNPDT
jgi:putative glutamine amidotransferase